MRRSRCIALASLLRVNARICPTHIAIITAPNATTRTSETSSSISVKPARAPRGAPRGGVASGRVIRGMAAR